MRVRKVGLRKRMKSNVRCCGVVLKVKAEIVATALVVLRLKMKNGTKFRVLELLKRLYWHIRQVCWRISTICCNSSYVYNTKSTARKG